MKIFPGSGQPKDQLLARSNFGTRFRNMLGGLVGLPVLGVLVKIDHTWEYHPVRACLGAVEKVSG